MQYAMMMTPPSEEDLEEELNEAPKERKLKKQ
jgi:hypothetical protein